MQETSSFKETNEGVSKGISLELLFFLKFILWENADTKILCLCEIFTLCWKHCDGL